MLSYALLQLALVRAVFPCNAVLATTLFAFSIELCCHHPLATDRLHLLLVRADYAAAVSQPPPALQSVQQQQQSQQAPVLSHDLQTLLQNPQLLSAAITGSISAAAPAGSGSGSTLQMPVGGAADGMQLQLPSGPVRGAAAPAAAAPAAPRAAAPRAKAAAAALPAAALGGLLFKPAQVHFLVLAAAHNCLQRLDRLQEQLQQ